MKPKLKKGWRLKTMLLTAVLILSSAGCSSISVKLDNSQRLMQRSDFTNAVVAAPEFVRDALKTINALEYQIENPKP